jgi:phage/plasmid primase-like uncharacterized protein
MIPNEKGRNGCNRATPEKTLSTNAADSIRIGTALQFIDASDRETWTRMAMAIKSELGDSGFDVWETWSQQAENYNAKAARDVWKSIRADGRISIGTLFYEAKANGWRDNGQHQKPTPEERAERKRIAAERAAKEEAEIARERASTAKKAEAVWGAATEAKADHPYLVRKQVPVVATLREIDASKAAALLGYAPKSGGDPLTGRLLVVPVKQGDDLSTLELIDGSGRKTALAGRGSKAGGYWATERLPDGDGAYTTLLIGEGVATVLSAMAATGHPVIAALSSGNLPAVAKAMRERYPAAALVILADLVKATGAPDHHASEAAHAVNGTLAIPDFGPDRAADMTDFNDMAAMRGAEAVERAIHDTAAPESRKRNDVHNVHNVHSDPTDASTDPTADALATCEAALAAAVDDPGVLASDGFVEASRLLREGAPEDWFRIRARLKAVAQGVGLKLGDIESMSAPAGDTANESEIADELVALVQEKADLFHAPDDTCYAALTDGPPACYRLDTKAFAKWLGYAYYTSTTTKDHPGRAASDTAMRTAVVVLSGIATNEGDERPVYLRAAQHGGAYYIDLGADDWSAVEVTPAGWRITARPPVQFWRSNTARPLPMPHAGGDLSRLWQYANVPAEQRPLVLAVLLEALRPETPFPILELIGQQGTAKSSTQARLRRLVDPNAVDLRAAPKSVEDLFVSAGANWVTSLNNLSHMSSQVQDALCNLATGGGFAGRTLYTNADETLIEAKRPVFINGIVPLVTAQDLTDRVVHIELPELAAYRPERELDAGFDADAPAIFGGLLDLFVATLAELPRVKLDRPPRMADFAALGEAMMRAEGNDPGAFVSLYSANRRESVARSLESSPVACAIRRLVDESSDTGTAWPRDGGPGTVEHLLTRLSDYREGADAWPRSARGLGDALRRQRPALAQIGIGIEFGRTSRGITVTIRRLPAEPVHVVHVVHVDPLSTLPARGVPPAFHHCATCQHLDGNHCRSRNEFIEHPSVGSCKRWEARGRIVRSEVRS